MPEPDNVLDKIFKAYDVRGVYPGQINEDLAWRIGFAAGQFLRSLLSGYDRGQASANRVVIGRDMRPHSEPLASHLMQGVLASGLSCVDIGMVDTPMVYFAVNHLGACGAIQVTASHNPMQYNGFKISGQKARPVGENTTWWPCCGGRPSRPAAPPSSSSTCGRRTASTCWAS